MKSFYKSGCILTFNTTTTLLSEKTCERFVAEMTLALGKHHSSL